MQFNIVKDELISCIPDIPDKIKNTDSGRIRIQSQELDLVIPNGVKKISKTAFDNCLYINTLFIPESVTTIHPLSLSKVSNLEEIYCEGLTHTGPTFKRVTALKRITFAKSLREIDDNAFNGIRTLEEINFIDCPLEKVGKMAFYQCGHLRSFVCPKTVKEIQDLAFTYCVRLESLVLNEGLEYFNFQSLCEVDNLTVDIPDSVKKLHRDPDVMYESYFRSNFAYRAKKGHPIFDVARKNSYFNLRVEEI